MDTFGRLPTDVLLLIKEFYQTPIFEMHYVESEESFDDRLFIYLVIKINTTITKLIIFETYEWYTRTKIQFYDARTLHETKDILVIILQLIDKLKDNKEFEMKMSFHVKLNEKELILKQEQYECILLNTLACRQSFIDALYDCYHYIEYYY